MRVRGRKRERWRGMKRGVMDGPREPGQRLRLVSLDTFLSLYL